MNNLRRCADHHVVMSVLEERKKKMDVTKEQKKERENLRNLILDEAKKGNICVYTIEGIMCMKLDEVIKQPTDGLLYDLNRDAATIMTFIDDPKWVNDYACHLVIKKLKEYYDAK